MNKLMSIAWPCVMLVTGGFGLLFASSGTLEPRLLLVFAGPEMTGQFAAWVYGFCFGFGFCAVGKAAATCNNSKMA